jgi:pimeloyl-ACP methyl ester carboxylesterase
MNAATMRGQRGNGNHDPPIKVDYLEAGSSGPVVMLVHSSVSGARQWRRLMRDLKDQFRVRAVNLFGYGKTTAWPAETIQSLDDQARLVEAALPANADEVYLVGHSFGGSVAMKAAARLEGRVARLVLLETNPFYLLAQSGRVDAFAEAMELRNYIKKFGALGEWATAAEKFADYWGGTGTWREMSLDRRAAFSEGLKPNFFEWDAVMNETTPVEQWATLLPGATLLVCDPRTVLPIREITAVLRRSCPGWAYKEVPGAGHMAPLTRPDLINPLVASFLGAAENNEGIELAAPNSRLRQSPLNACNVRETVCESAMSSTIRNAKSGSIQDTAAERWSRLYVDVRASYGRAAIQAALLLNGDLAGAVARLAVGV